MLMSGSFMSPLRFLLGENFRDPLRRKFDGCDRAMNQRQIHPMGCNA